MSSRAPLLVLSSLLTILLPSSSSTLHSVAGVATFSDGPALPLLLQFTGNLALVMLFTLPWGTLSRCSGACVLLIMLHLALRSLPVCSGSPRLCWVLGHIGARLLSTPTTSRSLPTWVSPLALHPRHSTNGFPVKSIPVFTMPFVTDSLPWCLTCMASLLTSLSDNFLPVTQNPVYSFNLPSSAFRLWGLARWGHDHSSTGRPSRHRQGPSTCPFCHDIDGSLMHHLSVCPSHRNARATWAHSCGISLPDASVLAQHSWVFNPLDEANTPQTIRAHILFVGHVCDQLQPPSW